MNRPLVPTSPRALAQPSAPLRSPICGPLDLQLSHAFLGRGARHGCIEHWFQQRPFHDVLRFFRLSRRCCLEAYSSVALPAREGGAAAGRRSHRMWQADLF